MKQKEIEFLSNLNEEWKKRDSEKKKIFKNAEQKMLQIEQKIKKKAIDLKKREQKIILVEQELKQKINETAKYVFIE